MSGGYVIVGAGARTPLGLDRSSTAAAVRAGIDAVAEHPFMIDRFGAPMRVSCDTSLDPTLMGPDRLAALAIAAAREALAPVFALGLSPKLSVAMSLGEVRSGQGAETGEEVATQLRTALDGPADLGRVLHWMGGHAGGIVAMDAAQQLLDTGRADFVLAGGVDSYLTPDSLEWLDETEQLHSEENIYGFCPGEAAGFVVITTRELAFKHGLEPLLELLATGTGSEENLIQTEDICLGEGLSDAFRGASAPLHEGQPVNRILCDMNGERYRGNEYGFAVLKNPDLFDDAADFEAPADCWGDVGAASGPLYAAMVIEAEARGYSKGPLSLIWASSEAGQRGAALLARPGGM
jgi:3-oxoacyl-[acyl-carrier-protein] synthase-1